MFKWPWCVFVVWGWDEDLCRRNKGIKDSGRNVVSCTVRNYSLLTKLIQGVLYHWVWCITRQYNLEMSSQNSGTFWLRDVCSSLCMLWLSFKLFMYMLTLSSKFFFIINKDRKDTKRSVLLPLKVPSAI